MPRRPLETEIAIVGAGPAGARASELLAAAGARVVLLDPRAPWEKPCGGGLTASAFDDLPELAELVPRTRPVRRLRIETSPDQGFTVELERPIRIVARREMARWQLRRARDAGAVHLGERVRSIARRADGWRLETDRGAVLAGLLVGADGAASRVRRSVAPRFRVELAPTRLFLVPGPGPVPDDMLLRFYRGVTGYVWDFPRPDHRSVGIVVDPGGWRRPRMDDEITSFRRSVEACPCSDEGTERAGAVIGTAQIGHGDYSSIGSRRFALLGDAAGLADPTTGEGIRNALRSADMLATAWRTTGTFEEYPDLARTGFDREFRIGRMLRRIVFDGGAAISLIEAAGRWNGARALVTALAEALNEQDESLLDLLGRWWRARSRIGGRRDRSRRGPRVPVPCATHAGSEAGPARSRPDPRVPPAPSVRVS